jgi:predicted nucleic acid-binding Zn ribbon protein
MSAEPLAESRCNVCGTPVTRDMARCPNCGLSHPTRVLARGGLWAAALVLLVAWLVALAIVAGAR